jgi:hypothetical protein
MSEVHKYGLFVMTKDRWHLFRAVCGLDGMKVGIRANHDVDEDEVADWRAWVMDDYEKRMRREIVGE